MTRRIGPTLLAAAAYALLLLWYSWPLATRLASALPASGRAAPDAFVRIDLDLMLWILAWGAHALRHQPTALFQGNLFYPAPDALAASENLLGLQPIAAPVFWLSGNATLTYNITVLLVVFLAALCGFLAVRAWTGRPSAGFLAGLCFALAPPVFADWVRLHWSAVALFPLIAALAWHAARRPRALLLTALSLLTALQTAAGVYVAFTLLLWLAALTPALLLEARLRGRSGLAVVAALVAGLLLASPLALPYLRVRRLGGFPDLASALEILRFTSAQPAALLAAIPRDLSWPVTALAALALLGRKRPSRPLRLAIAGAGLSGFVLACGTSLPGLYRAAMEIVPGFSTIRGPERFFVLTILAGALLGGIGASDLLSQLRSRGLLLRQHGERLLAAMAIVLALWRAPAEPLRLSEVSRTGVSDAHRWLAANGDGGVLLELPVYRSPLETGPLRVTGSAMVGSTLHWLPIVNGYSGHPPPSAGLLQAIAARLPDPDAFTDLCHLVRLRWILLHRDALPRGAADWSAALAALPLRPAARFGPAEIFEVTKPCGAAEDRLRAELRGERRGRTLGDVPLVALPPEGLRGRVRVRAPARMAAGLAQVVEVEVTNQSDLTWPGQTSQSAGRVAVQTRWYPGGAAPPQINDFAVPLGRDLAPGDSLRLTASAFGPAAGHHALEVGLVQEGRGWFADLGGTAVIRLPVETLPVPPPPARRSPGGAS